MTLPERNTFSTANPHALATILEASETKTIIACRDIFDLSGIKLWAREQPVSAALQRKLLDRRLRNPLETCLTAEDGVAAHTLLLGLQQLVDGDGALGPLLAPHAAVLLREVVHLPLHPVAQLLLTAAQASRPESFDHALQAMATCGALMLAQGGRTAEIRVAMLAGLLHDLGEMYIDPGYGEADIEGSLDFASYQQLVVHPHVGKLLIAQLTNYPHALAVAVGEHHERLDGSGYPYALAGEQVSPLGRLVAVAEGALGTLRGGRAGLARASIALRAVPGEFDLQVVGAIAAAARAAPAAQPRLALADVQQRLLRLDATLSLAAACASTLAPLAHTPGLQQAIALGSHLLERLRTGLNASGLWSDSELAEQDVAEVEAVEDELAYRLRSIDRAMRLRAGELPPGDAERLARLGEALRGTPL